MSLDYEINAWSEIERADRFLDGRSISSAGDVSHHEVQAGKLRPKDESLALQYYDLLNVATIEAGLIETCNYSEIEQGVFLGAGATMTVHRGIWRNRAVAVK